MKIIIINGSPRANGSTASMLKTIQAYLESKSDVETGYYHLNSMDMSFCSGCCACYSLGSCYMKDDAEKLSVMISEADAVIIGTPTYAGNVSGQLKVFIDRSHFVMEQLLYQKYGMAVVTGENYGLQHTVKILKRLFSFSGAYVSAAVALKLPFSQTVKDRQIMNGLLKKKAESFYRDIRNKRIYHLQKLIHNIVFNVGIKPFVLRKGKQYRGVLKHWDRNGIPYHETVMQRFSTHRLTVKENSSKIR